MAGAAMQGLFGPGVDDVRLAIAQQGQAQDMQYAQMPMGRGPVALAAAAGRGVADIVNGVTGREDPRIARARAMQEAAQEVDSQGYSLMEDSQAYYKAAYNSLMKRGLTQEAAHVRDLAINEQATQADIGLKSAQARETVANIGKGTYSTSKDGRVTTNTRTGEVRINEGVPKDPKNLSSVGKIMNDYDNGVFGERNSPEAIKLRDAAIEKATNTRDPYLESSLALQRTITGIAASAAARDASQFQREQLAVAGKTMNSLTQRTAAASDMRDASNQIISSLETGSTATGGLVDLRYNLSKLVELALPDYSDKFNSTLNVDPKNVEVINQASDQLVSSLSAYYSAYGERSGATGFLKQMKTTGKGASLSPEGLYVLASLNKAKADRELAIRDKLAQWLAPREGETFDSDSVIQRQTQVDAKLLELESQTKATDFLPPDLERKAAIAAKKATIPLIDISSINKPTPNKRYRSLTNGKIVYWVPPGNYATPDGNKQYFPQGTWAEDTEFTK